ncbi:LacI family transcriptional regulator [Mycolicibacterium agri]|uniref:LacI family transcriptional regulator n=1 Tax=Mycolicibacterium agri TaxID=36811 RepID=A0A7I9W420_MYCAG|nr:LacI family transcriptional regulator [Mycolicibacterium agri]
MTSSAPGSERSTPSPPPSGSVDTSSRLGCSDVNGQGLYIQQAAKLVGATPDQLRKWEQQRLITPARTQSGYRTYTIEDIERMRRIQSLMAAGVNAAGVRRLLDESGQPSPNGSPSQPAPAHARGVGNTIRDLRREHKLTLRDLSARTGLSASYISALERGTAAPSIASLQKIAAVFDTNVLGLMNESYDAPNLLVRADARRIIQGERGVRIEDMSTSGTNLEPLLFTFEPGCGSDGAISHEGEEFLFVMCGQLHLRLDNSDDYFLDPGDSMSFRSERPHAFGNASSDGPPTVVLWINTPRTF